MKTQLYKCTAKFSPSLSTRAIVSLATSLSTRAIVSLAVVIHTAGQEHQGSGVGRNLRQGVC